MVTVITGENDILRTTELQRITSEFIKQHGDIALERLDCEESDYERMHEAIRSLPFLSPKKLVVLRRPSANKEFMENFATFLADVAETNDVIIVEPKLDTRLVYYKSLKNLKGFKEFSVLDASGLIRFLGDYAKHQGGTLRAGEARLLMDRVGLNQLTLQNEVDKLLAYDVNVSRENIELLTERTPQSSIFELLDAAFSGNTKRAMSLYREQRALKVEPQQIIAMLVWQLHILALVKTAGERSASEVSKQAKISPFTVQKTQGLARSISLMQLKKLVADLRSFDVRLKSEGILADEVVQYYLLNLTH